jgi:hypothetical protein
MGSSRASAAAGAGQERWRSSAHRRPGSTYGHHLRPKKRHTLGDAPTRDGLRLWYDLLEKTYRVARGRSLGRAAQGASRPFRRSGSDRLVKGIRGLGQRGRSPGGSNTGPNPTDRGKPGTKHHLLVDHKGTPLVAIQSGANVHDSKMFEEVVDAVEPIKAVGRGRPRKRPEKLHADKAYDSKKCPAKP